jgi:hypothetical protein
LDFLNFVKRIYKIFVLFFYDYLLLLDFKILNSVTLSESLYLKINKWSFDVIAYKIVILYWYICIICYDLFNFEFLKIFFFDIPKYILIATAFINFLFDMVYYIYMRFVYIYIEKSYIHIFVNYWFLYFCNFFYDIVKYLNVVTLSYFFWETWQYYVDSFSFNLEISRLNFFDPFYGEKRFKNSFRRKKIFKRFKSFDNFHYSLIYISILQYLRLPTFFIFFDRYTKFDIPWFRYLYSNFLLFYISCFFILFICCKKFSRLFFIDYGIYGNPDYLWTLFRNRRIEDVDWLYKKLNVLVQLKRAQHVVDAKYTMFNEDYKFVQQIKFKNERVLSIDEFSRLHEHIGGFISRNERLHWDREYAKRWWLHESKQLFEEGNVDFLEFFNSPYFKSYYDNLTRNYFNLLMLVAYGFNRDEIIRKLVSFECEPEVLEKFFLDEFVIKKNFYDIFRNYFYYLDEKLYNYKLPYWALHKDFFKYQLLNQDVLQFEKQKKHFKGYTQIVIDVESFASSVLVWFVLVPYLFFKYVISIKYGFFRYKANWVNLVFVYRNFLAHFLFFHFPLFEKLCWTYWYAPGWKRLHAVYSGPYKVRTRVYIPEYSRYFSCYYEGAYAKWISERPNAGWVQFLGFVYNFNFRGVYMVNSSFYFFFFYIYLILFVFVFLKIKKQKQIKLNNKHDLMFFTRKLLIKIWKFETYIKFKNILRISLFKNVTFGKK